jgi:hypothetical protein
VAITDAGGHALASARREGSHHRQVVAAHSEMLTQRTRVAGQRILTLLAGEQLQRIC